LRTNSAGFYVPTSGDGWADYDQKFINSETGVEPLDSWNIETPFSGNYGQIQKLKTSGKRFNVGLSVGGWSWSTNFSPSMATSETRRAFVNEVIAIFKKYPIFNRLDIDWEYISPEGKSYGMAENKTSAKDPENYADFLKLMREALNANGFGGYEMSMCTTAAPEKMDIMPIAAMVKYLDTINIMTYDHQDGAWGVNITGHNSNVYKTTYTQFAVEDSVKKLISLGVPSTKILIGAAYYSRGFSNTDGLGKSCSGGSTDKSWEAGIVDYKNLPLPGATEYYDEKAGAGYSYDPAKRILNSYDTVRSVQEKANFVIKNNLGGIIVWEASGDRPISSGKSLTRAMSSILKPGKGTTPVPAPKPVPIPKPPFVPVVPPAPIPSNPSEPVDGEEWAPNVSYTTGDRVRYNNSLYVCLMSHVSQATWTPKSPALWKFINSAAQPPAPTPVPTPTPKPNPSNLFLDANIKSITIDVSDIKFNL
jgi:chitinase